MRHIVQSAEIVQNQLYQLQLSIASAHSLAVQSINLFLLFGGNGSILRQIHSMLPP